MHNISPSRSNAKSSWLMQSHNEIMDVVHEIKPKKTSCRYFVSSTVTEATQQFGGCIVGPKTYKGSGSQGEVNYTYPEQMHSGSQNRIFTSEQNSFKDNDSCSKEVNQLERNKIIRCLTTGKSLNNKEQETMKVLNCNNIDVCKT